MDANETHYHLLLGHADWANCLAEDDQTLHEHWLSSPLDSPLVPNASGLVWNDTNHELTLQPRLVEFATSKYDDKLTFECRRGAGHDRYGNWYWISESGTEIRVQSSGTGRTSHFWSAGDGFDCEPQQRYGDFAPKEIPKAVETLVMSGLTVTEDHYLVVGALQPKGLLVFDLHSTGSPRQLLWPADVAFVPFDMAPRPGGGVWILDRMNRRYWGLDRKLHVIRLDTTAATLTTEDFQPIDQVETRRTSFGTFPEAITLDMSSPIYARAPVAIDALPDGSVIILDNVTSDGFSRLYRYRLDQQLGGVASLNAVLHVVEEGSQSHFHLVGYDLAFVPAHKTDNPLLLGKVFVAAMTGNQCYVFDVFGNENYFYIQAQAEYYPMRLFGGKAIVTAGDLVHYDFNETWMPLVQQKRPRYVLDATFLTPIEKETVLDGKQPDCVWHRLMLDACIPPESSVIIASRTSNERNLLEHAPWCSEPRLHKRKDGSELPFVSKAEAQDAGTWELLFQHAKGRYLQLKVVLLGKGRSTPRLHSLRVYYPRFSYLEHYLPAVYRDDEQSASFLERYLANEEGTLTALEDKIASVQILFDVRSAPTGALEWLANWFGIVLDPAWDERRRRLFIKHAMDLFQYRGTIQGLLIVLHLGLEQCVDERIFTQRLEFCSSRAKKEQTRLSSFRIVEDFRTRQTPPVVLGDPTDSEGLRVVTVSQRWDPTQGMDVLNQRWKEAISSSYEVVFPIRDPGEGKSSLWRSFARAVLGFIPSSDPMKDQVAWQNFLSNRYITINALNVAYALSKQQQYDSFDQVSLPMDLPGDGVKLLDWYEFEGTILPMHGTAHHFVVLLPTSSRLNEAQRQERVAIAQRVIDLEKPAHTNFQVKFYWAMFRVGEARLGADTLIDVGSRAPDLMPPFVLGRDYLSEGYLSPGYPQNVQDRLVLNRDRLGNDPDSRYPI